MQSKDSVLLEDILPVGLRYVENSLTVQKEGADNNAETADAGQYTWKTTDTDNGQKLNFDYSSGKEFTDKLVLSFRTKVDVDAIDSFQDKTSFDIRNSIVLKREGCEDLTETADQKINNNILDKKGTYEKSQGTITYTVNLNPHAIELKNITVRDELPKGLQLDKDTVRLYKADAKENGTLEKGDEIILDDILTANVLDGWFEIKIPTGNMSYILQYVTDVTDITQTTFYNKISMKGSASITPPSGGSNVNLGGGGGGGGGTASPKVNLTLDLKDTLRPGVNLEGAVFRIYDGEEPLNEVTTDKEGKAVFRYLKRGKTYRVEQISAPTGYKMTDTPISIEISNDNNITPKEYKYPALFNQPVTGTLSFTKTNGNERLLEGAEFTLTDKTPESILVKTAISDEGGIVSFMDIPYGEYELEETRAPEYHELNSTVYKVAVNEDGQVSLTDPVDFDTLLTEIVNVPQKGMLAIVKTDEETDDVLPGVEFTLYTWNDEKNERGDEFAVGETDGNGRLSFDVNLGERYELVETKSLPGYGTAFELKNLFDSITKTKDGLMLTVYDKDTPLTLDLTNKAHTTDLVFRLVNNRGIPMAQTKVWLVELDTDGNPTGRQLESEASFDGTVIFRNVRRNANYSIFTAPIDSDAIIPDLTELLMNVTVPADVSEAPTVIRPDGQEDTLTKDYLVIGITPAEEQWILTVNIIDSKTKNPLPGATVGLYVDESCTTLIKNANSSGDGALSFDGLIKGQKYWLREDIQPGGYKPENIVHLVEETNPVVSIENMKESDESNSDSGGTTNPNPTDPPSTDSKPTEPEQAETTKPSQKPAEPEQAETTKPSQKPTEPEQTEMTKSSQKHTESAELSGSSKPGVDVPRTGDNSNLTLVFVLLIVSGIGSIMMCLYSRRFGAVRITEIQDTFTEIQ